jgi:hypothetical protein
MKRAVCRTRPARLLGLEASPRGPEGEEALAKGTNPFTPDAPEVFQHESLFIP